MGIAGCLRGKAVSGTHDRFSPSRLAYLDLCLDWQGSERSDAADYGTKIHKLIYDIAIGNAVEVPREDFDIASRALSWLGQHVGEDGKPLEWTHEQRIDGVVPETGGTIDAWAYDPVSKTAVIVDWKGSLPLPNSMQGKAYALNLWHQLECAEQPVECVRVWFYNYMNGDANGAVYNNKMTLHSDITALLRRYSGQMGHRRSANPGCSYCKHRANCEVAMTETHTELDTSLTVADNLQVMPVTDLLAFYDRLKAVMKRAESLESAAKERLMAAAKAGELPGYTVKTKRGNKLEWADEIAAKEAARLLLDNHFADADIYGLLPVTKLKDKIKAAIGESHSKEVDSALAPYISQNSYEMLTKEKE